MLSFQKIPLFVDWFGTQRHLFPLATTISYFKVPERALAQVMWALGKCYSGSFSLHVHLKWLCLNSCIDFGTQELPPEEFCLEVAKHIVSNKITSHLMLICTSNILQYLPNCLASTVVLPQWKKQSYRPKPDFLLACAIHAHDSHVHV